jgi:phosphatidylserine/phosphatidylglycerophosphate/cardiolipin synthase-like enzyme
VIRRRQPSAGATVLAVVVAALLAALQGCALPSPAATAVRQLAPPANELAQGNDARILVDGPATHRAMFAAVTGARDHVNLQSYILDASEVGEKLAALLKAKAAQGVKVNVLYDSVGSLRTPRRQRQERDVHGAARGDRRRAQPRLAHRRLFRARSGYEAGAHARKDRGHRLGLVEHRIDQPGLAQLRAQL